jgi:hypothetical protein
MSAKFASFGLTMSDGNTQQAGLHHCDQRHQLPQEIKQIETIFNSEDNNIHSIRFYARTLKDDGEVVVLG